MVTAAARVATPARVAAVHRAAHRWRRHPGSTPATRPDLCARASLTTSSSSATWTPSSSERGRARGVTRWEIARERYHRHFASAPFVASAAASGGAGAAVRDGDGDKTYEAIIVVAGGMTDDGGLPAWVTSRLDFVKEEYDRHVAAKREAPYVVLAGSATPHKPPPLAKGGFLLHESTAMATYLADRGVPRAKMLKDTASMDTIGNAYFTLTSHAIPRGWRDVLIVTSKFHMGRTRAAFEWVWNLYVPSSDGAGAAAGDAAPSAPHVRLSFHATPDDGLDASVIEARAAREAKSEAALRKNATEVTTLAAFAEWQFTTHMCYAVLRQDEIGEFEEMKTDPALKSY